MKKTVTGIISGAVAGSIVSAVITLGAVGYITKDNNTVIKDTSVSVSQNFSEAKLLSGEISTAWPATMLNMHSDVVVICDKEAYNG